jgi:hypothetical protein
MKKLIIALAFLTPSFAFASPYALEMSAPCSMQAQDSAGNTQTVTEPAGYVTDIAAWDGVTQFSPLDPCGHPETLIPQVAGIPAVGTGGVTTP